MYKKLLNIFEYILFIIIIICIIFYNVFRHIITYPNKKQWIIILIILLLKIYFYIKLNYI